MPYSGQSPRSAGVAVLLSFLLLGAGHLYLGKTGTGVALIAWDVFLLLLWLIPLIGFVVSVMLWIVSFIIVAITVSNEVGAQNRALFGR